MGAATAPGLAMICLFSGEGRETFFRGGWFLSFVPQWTRHERFAGFAAAYRILALLTLFLPMLVLANWGHLSYLAFDPAHIKNSYQVLGFVMSALVTWLGVRRGWNHVVNTGVVFFLIFLYTKFFDWWWESMPKYLFFLVIGMTAVLFLLVFLPFRARF